MSTPITPATHTITFDSLSKTISPNLIKDGGFKDEDLTNWTANDTSAGESAHDPLVKYQNFPSLRLKITDTDDDAERYQDIVPDEDSTNFKFCGVIKTENLGADDNDKFICVDVYYTDGTSDLASANADQKLTPSYDTQGFELVEGSFTTNGAKKIDYLRLRCRLADISNQSGNGYMWVTQLVLIESTNVKENETFDVDNDGDICVQPKIKITGKTNHNIDQMAERADTYPSTFTISATTTYIAQTFTPEQVKFSRVAVCVSRVGSPNSGIHLKLCPLDSNGDPDESTIISQEIIQSGSINTTATWRELHRMPFANLDLTKQYALIMVPLATNYSPGSIEHKVHGNDISSIYDGGDYWISTDSGTNWTQHTDKDIAFYTKYPLRCGENIKYKSTAKSSEDNTEYEFGKVGTEEEKQAQIFKSDFTNRLYSITIKPFTKTGSPTDAHILISIQTTVWDSTNSRWEPSGVVLCEKKIAVDDWNDRESTTWADSKLIEVIFDNPPQLKKDVNYAIVIERSGSLSNTLHFAIHGSDTSNDNYADGQALYWNGSAWTAGHANNDICFSIRYTIDDTNIRLSNETTGDFFELDGELMLNAEVHIYPDGKGEFIHDYYDATGDRTYDLCFDIYRADIRAHTTGDFTINSLYLFGQGQIIFEHNMMFKCIDNPVLKYGFDDSTWTIYYSLDGSSWTKLVSGGDMNHVLTSVKIPVLNVSKFYLKVVSDTSSWQIDQWQIFADLDCSQVISKLRLPAIGNSSVKSVFSNLNTEFDIDLEWIEVDGLSKGFVISDEPKYGYEMNCRAVGLEHIFQHTYHKTITGFGFKQKSKFRTLGGVRCDMTDYDNTNNFPDLAKLNEWIDQQKILFARTKYKYWVGIPNRIQMNIVGGQTTFRHLVFDLNEVRQLK